MTANLLSDLTILYVEDNKAIRENTILSLNLLNATIIGANNGQEGLDSFIKNNSKIDIILTDISMPVMNGLEMIEEIKKIKSDIPILITTAHQEIPYLKKAIELGVTSYILKPINVETIINSIVKAMEPILLKNQLIEKNQELLKLNNSLEEKIKERTKELELLASTDFLTGIHNRRNFFYLAKKRFNKTPSNQLYAIMIDVDNFKKVNDTYGHQVGDKILKLLTKNISLNLNEDDIFGRIGGEEFAIIYEGNKNDAQDMKKIKNLKNIIENLTYNDIQFTISIGVALKHENDSNIDMLLSRADKGLYEAKNAGRNKVIFRDY